MASGALNSRVQTYSERLDRAFILAPRQAFLPDEAKQYANEDRPLSIGHGQTNSQPTTVRRMLEWLNVKDGAHILDVGAGSGWTSALLSQLVGPDGRVDAIEKVPELVLFGRQNCVSVGIHNVVFHEAADKLGLPEKAPYDNILVSAASDEIPEELIDQLANGGTMVVPVGYDIAIVTKADDGTVGIMRHPGYLFVPLIQDD